MPNANIRVVCRFRPTNKREQKEKKDKIVCQISEDGTKVQVDNGKVSDTKSREFVFDRIFDPSTTQYDVFVQVGIPLVESLLNGYNCTLFAYGQTGSGKTHTMEGDIGNAVHQGLIPRMVGELFERITNLNNNSQSNQSTFFLQISYLEIYNEKLKDLLEPNNEPRLRGGGGKDGNDVIIQHVCEEYVSSADEVFNCIQRGAVNRSVGETGMNAKSSRSHAVFTLKLTQENTQDSTKKNSKLLLVDLAGSEKVNKTGAKGQLLEEAKNINKSLSTLGRVISKLSKAQSENNNKQYIPYRDSVLTRLLSDALGGNSQTCLILACSPAMFNCEETLSTLRFGQRAKEIKNNVSINEELSVAEYKKRLKAANKIMNQLKAENQQLKYKVESLKNTMNDKNIVDPSAQELIDKIEKEYPISNLLRTMAAIDNSGNGGNGGNGGDGGNNKSSGSKRPKFKKKEDDTPDIDEGDEDNDTKNSKKRSHSTMIDESSNNSASNDKRGKSLQISLKDVKSMDMDNKDEENRATSPALSTVSSSYYFPNLESSNMEMIKLRSELDEKREELEFAEQDLLRWREQFQELSEGHSLLQKKYTQLESDLISKNLSIEQHKLEISQLTQERDNLTFDFEMKHNDMEDESWKLKRLVTRLAMENKKLYLNDTFINSSNKVGISMSLFNTSMTATELTDIDAMIENEDMNVNHDISITGQIEHYSDEMKQLIEEIKFLQKRNKKLNQTMKTKENRIKHFLNKQKAHSKLMENWKKEFKQCKEALMQCDEILKREKMNRQYEITEAQIEIARLKKLLITLAKQNDKLNLFLEKSQTTRNVFQFNHNHNNNNNNGNNYFQSGTTFNMIDTIDNADDGKFMIPFTPQGKLLDIESITGHTIGNHNNNSINDNDNSQTRFFDKNQETSFGFENEDEPRIRHGSMPSPLKPRLQVSHLNIKKPIAKKIGSTRQVKYPARKLRSGSDDTTVTGAMNNNNDDMRSVRSFRSTSSMSLFSPNPDVRYHSNRSYQSRRNWVMGQMQNRKYFEK